ncbi:MAG: type II toxin-antitoxin system RelE/ParE family toxin [Balneolaceae bacterium]|nr:type II toxin-antitoxin system RelE/ParE family toxin [Balneolaceae bacterium]
MALKVVWTKTAQSDREKIFEFWNKHNASKEYSRKLNQQIQKKIELTKYYPEAGLSTNLKPIRFHLIDRHFKLFYRVESERIIILRFWDTRQDPDSLNV